MRGHRDLELAVLAAGLAALVALLVPVDELRLVGALPLALLLPGYAIVAVAFARRPLPPSHTAALSIALSLMVLVLGALLLNYGPGGIRTLTWAILLFVVVLAACRGAALRRPAPRGRRERPAPRLSPAQGSLLAGALLATIAALVLAFTTLPANDALGYTELWLLPRDGDRSELQVGVRSEEQDPVAYRLRVSYGGGLPATETGFSLEPGESRVLDLPPLASPDGDPVPVTATLFLEDFPGDVYRRVTGYARPPGEPQ